jgi:hypothetical protein
MTETFDLKNYRKVQLGLNHLFSDHPEVLSIQEAAASKKFIEDVESIEAI